MRPWTSGQRDALHGGTMHAKPLSKLDNARLKLSKLKLKYGKQEKHIDVDPTSSSTDLSSRETSLAETNIPKILSKEPSENLDLAGNSEVTNRDSESFESDSLKSVPSKELYSEHSPKAGLPEEKLIQSRTGSHQSDSFVSEIQENIHSFSSLELMSRIQDDDVSLKPVPDDFVVNNAAPAVILKRDTTETSVSSIADTPQSASRDAQTEHSQMTPMAALQETSNTASYEAASERTLKFRDKTPDQDSSLTLVSLKTEPRRRNVKVQTNRKRSRTVQVSLSEQTYEERSRPSYPILRATSLPRGLRIREDESFGCLASDMEDALQLLLRSQVKLTLNLLQREQSLYFNCSRSAARLERGYKRHTLSDTRQFLEMLGNWQKLLKGRTKRVESGTLIPESE